ncbi:fumarylacetoacetate hydrolase family protein, partial [Flavobacteriaceae bacterium]|nr:fumarylacetoacetate hydrolase family protein [Flavobacteriaceae bacterium]
QSATTSDMLWNIDEIIAYVSQFFTLKIGDIIFTGTPSGVSRVQPNDSLKGFIGEEEFFSIKVK